MKHLLLSVLLVLTLPLTAADKTGKAKTPPKQNEKEKEKKTQKAPLKILTAEELDKLYARRLEGGMQYSLAQFANMFFVSSHINLGIGIALSPADKETAEKELQSPFPEFYKPTLREFFDAIALQTSSAWSYKKESQFVHTTDPKPKKEPSADSVVINFDPAKREKPFQVKVAQDWKMEDRGHWMTYIPPSYPVGMDIYEVGTYSPKDKEDAAALFGKVRTAVALEWAQRVKQDAKEAELKPAKVGKFEALHFDAMIPSRSGPEVRWRHWVFMDGNKCYFIVSTIFPDKEKEIFPDVEAMLKSFETKPATAPAAPQPAPAAKKDEPKK